MTPRTLFQVVTLIAWGTAVWGCSGAGPEEASRVRIYGGEPTQGFPAVVELLPREGERCTGTFVSPTTLITAAHCVTSGLIGETGPPEYLEVVDGNSGLIRSDQVFQAGGPGSSWESPLAVAHKDVAVGVFSRAKAKSILGGEMLETFPRVLSTEDFLEEGMSVTLVGFGRGDPNDDNGSTGGTKRVTQENEAIAELNGPRICTKMGDAGILTGDSGGPMFVEETFVGVASGTETGCGDWLEEGAEWSDERMDRHANLAHPVVRAILKRAVRGGADIPGVSISE